MIQKITIDLSRRKRFKPNGNGGNERLVIEPKSSKKMDIKFMRRKWVTNGFQRSKEGFCFVEIFGNGLRTFLEGGKGILSMQNMSLCFGREKTLKSCPNFLRSRTIKYLSKNIGGERGING